jgi:hypothetical protein
MLSLSEATALSQVPHAFHVPRFLQLLEDSTFPDKATLAQALTEGFDLGYMGGMEPRRCKNLEIMDRPFLSKYISVELAAGRILEIDPKDSAQVVFSPIGCVPKAGQLGKWRIIHHLSYPRRSKSKRSVNQCLRPVTYTIDAMDELLAWLRHMGPNAWLAKADASCAFRQCGVRPDQRWLLGFSFDDRYFLDCVLPMGSISSPYLWNLVASAVVWFAKSRGCLRITCYVDDFIFVGNSEQECNSFLDCFLSVCASCGVQVAMKKTFRASQSMEILGILFDTVSYTISLTPEKISRTLEKIQDCVTQAYCFSKVESLGGTLLWISGVILQGRPFTLDLLQLNKTLPGNQQALPDSMKSILSWWSVCLSATTAPFCPISKPDVTD